MNRMQLKNVTLSVEGRTLFPPLNMEIEAKAPMTLIGSSGAGKSSLLAWLSGHLPKAFTATGEAWLNGERIDNKTPHQRRLGVLFQDDLLFPHLSVAENLAFAMPSSREDKALRNQQIAQVLEQAGLEGLQSRDPQSLSGGQKARVALLRVMLSKPLALLLDEPFSKLDPALRAQFRKEVFSQAAKERIPVLQVSHDPEDARAAGGGVFDLLSSISSL